MLSDLPTLRHSTAHVMAQAIQKLFPSVKLAIGPSIENGFYYDIDLDTKLSDKHLIEIERVMTKIIKEEQIFECEEFSKQDALNKCAQEPYKLEIINDLNEERYTFYKNGPFEDLCRGPHIQNTGQISAFKLLKVSGAYWRGDEKNKMLQRIYGTAFHSQEDLDTYLKFLVEAEERDHRHLGKQLDLFSMSDDVGPGLVLWHPKGAFIKDQIETYWKQMHRENDYQLIQSPHVGKQELWQTSGHLDFYEENMFSPAAVDELPYFVKPMNCPFHIKVYQSKQRSYKEFPLRYAELGTVYRYERSGVLHGLFRVRGFTQDDAHIFCTQTQISDEIKNIIELCMQVFKKFEFTEYEIFISTRPQSKYVGEASLWDLAEDALKVALNELGINYQIDEGGGAFYGPKIDIKIKDAIGRKWQCTTVQLDFNLPERFKLYYVNNEGDRQMPIMIHRALFGSLERFMGILIEHYKGKFPAWLAPTQIVLLPLKKDFLSYAETLKDKFQNLGIRVDVDASKSSLNAKIKTYTHQKIPLMGIIGGKEAESNKISVRHYIKGDLGAITFESCMKQLEIDDQ